MRLGLSIVIKIKNGKKRNKREETSEKAEKITGNI